MSIFSLFFNGMFPLGSLIGGSIAQVKDASFALMVSGFVLLSSLLALTALHPQLHRL